MAVRRLSKPPENPNFVSSFHSHGLKMSPSKGLGGDKGLRPIPAAFVARRHWLDEARDLLELVQSGLNQREAGRQMGYSDALTSRILNTLNLPACLLCHAGQTDNQRGRVLYSRELFLGLVDLWGRATANGVSRIERDEILNFFRMVSEMMARREPLTIWFIRTLGRTNEKPD